MQALTPFCWNRQGQIPERVEDYGHVLKRSKSGTCTRDRVKDLARLTHYSAAKLAGEAVGQNAAVPLLVVL
jgi:hypothetical protein